jgi:REP element-mobilizing transposase RayT
LCGHHGRRDYSHRKQWLLQRLHVLAGAFAVEVHAYAIMSNHFHLVVYYDPLACKAWSDDEVAERWLSACPPMAGTEPDRRLMLKQALIDDAERLGHVRTQLGSLSTFMKLLKQPIARRANLEDRCTGHFFEQRFYCAALLDEQAVMAAMAYVDLNPIRAKIANSLEHADHTSIAQRLANDALDQPITAVVSGLPQRQPDITISLRDYVSRLTACINPANQPQRWQQRVALLKKKQRAFGPINLIRQWINHRGMQSRETPLP